MSSWEWNKSHISHFNYTRLRQRQPDNFFQYTWKHGRRNHFLHIWTTLQRKSQIFPRSLLSKAEKALLFRCHKHIKACRVRAALEWTFIKFYIISIFTRFQSTLKLNNYLILRWLLLLAFQLHFLLLLMYLALWRWVVGRATCRGRFYGFHRDDNARLHRISCCDSLVKIEIERRWHDFAEKNESK